MANRFKTKDQEPPAQLTEAAWLTWWTFSGRPQVIPLNRLLDAPAKAFDGRESWDTGQASFRAEDAEGVNLVRVVWSDYRSYPHRHVYKWYSTALGKHYTSLLQLQQDLWRFVREQLDAR